MTKLLIAKKANVNYIAEVRPYSCSNQSCAHDSGEQIGNCQDGATPLVCAVQHRHRKVVDVLLGSAADVNLRLENGVAPLYTAAQEGSRTFVTWLIQAKAELDLQANVCLDL